MMKKMMMMMMMMAVLILILVVMIMMMMMLLATNTNMYLRYVIGSEHVGRSASTRKTLINRTARSLIDHHLPKVVPQIVS